MPSLGGRVCCSYLCHRDSLESACKREPKLRKPPSACPVDKPLGIFLTYDWHVRTHLTARAIPGQVVLGCMRKANYAGQKDQTGKQCSSVVSALVLPWPPSVERDSGWVSQAKPSFLELFLVMVVSTVMESKLDQASWTPPLSIQHTILILLL